MGPQRTVVRHAPGKLFVAGEYAVVEPGNPAILTAVDRRVSVSVTESGVADVDIRSDLCPQGARFRRSPGRPNRPGGLGGCGPEDGRLAREGLKHAVSAIEVVDELLAERGLPAPRTRVAISSRLHDGGTKFGLGSSGAVTVATVTAQAAYCGIELSPEARFRLAMLATARVDPGASGGDLAASSWGGWIAYHSPDRAAVLDMARNRGVEETLRAPWPGFGVRRLPPPPGLALEVGWTGEPASSTSLVADLGSRQWRGGASHRRFLERSAECVRASVRAFQRDGRQELLDQIHRARRMLARLDDEVGLGVFTSKLTALCDAAEGVGGAAKPSGAGGGDCGIAFMDAEASTEISRLRARWAAAGVLPLPIRPSDERNVRNDR